MKITLIVECVGRCQRSSNCPMCWQGISLKDPARYVADVSFNFGLISIFLLCSFVSCIWLNLVFNHGSQELLEAVECEKSFRFTPSRNAAIFRHPTLGDFELQHVCYPYFQLTFEYCHLMAPQFYVLLVS